MGPLCYRRHRFPPEIIQQAIWLYLRFTLAPSRPAPATSKPFAGAN